MPRSPIPGVSLGNCRDGLSGPSSGSTTDAPLFPKWVEGRRHRAPLLGGVLATRRIPCGISTVLFDPDVYPMETHWLTGRISADHLKRTRPGYYARLKAREDDASDSEG